MMKEGEHVRVAPAVETVELRLHPVELRVIGRNHGVDGEHESIAVPEGIGRVTRQPA